MFHCQHFQKSDFFKASKSAWFEENVNIALLLMSEANLFRTKVTYANRLDSDETPSYPTFHPDPNCLTLGHYFRHLWTTVKLFENCSRLQHIDRIWVKFKVMASLCVPDIIISSDNLLYLDTRYRIRWQPSKRRNEIFCFTVSIETVLQVT